MPKWIFEKCNFAAKIAKKCIFQGGSVTKSENTKINVGGSRTTPFLKRKTKICGKQCIYSNILKNAKIDFSKVRFCSKNGQKVPISGGFGDKKWKHENKRRDHPHYTVFGPLKFERFWTIFQKMPKWIFKKCDFAAKMGKKCLFQGGSVTKLQNPQINVATTRTTPFLVL